MSRHPNEQLDAEDMDGAAKERRLEAGSRAAPCSRCHGQWMIPSDDLDGDIMNEPCPDCNEWSPDFHANIEGSDRR